MENETTTIQATPATAARTVPVTATATPEVVNKGGRPAPDAWRQKTYASEQKLQREIAQHMAGRARAKELLEMHERDLAETKHELARVAHLRARVPRWQFERAFGDKALGEKLLTDAVRSQPNYAQKKEALDKFVAAQLAAITADTIGFDLPAGE